MSDELHTKHSALREKIVEHIFVGDLLRTLWRRGVVNLEVLHSEFDAHGYDVVFERGSVVRHVQLRTKLQRIGAPSVRPDRVSISRRLAEKPGGCVIWIVVSPALDLGPFYWFGGDAGMALPNMVGFRTPKRLGRRAKGDRPMRTNHSTVPRAAFARLDSIDDVISKLFGS